MKIAGVISEFNPFHNGHAYLCDEIKAAGMTHIVSVMSGSFTQRGEPAILDKWTRAKAALACGVDLVLELPIQYSMASAGRFAMGGVGILSALPIDTLCFGSEVGSIPLLDKTLAAITKSEAHQLMTEALKKGVSYPRALSKTVRELFGSELAEIAASPNNLLAIEYLKASKQLKTHHDFFTILRKGACHDSQATSETIASASYLRELIKGGSALTTLSSYVPSAALDIYKAAFEEGCAPLLLSRLELAVLCKLRQMQPNDFLLLPEVSEGLENRLHDAAIKATSLEEFYDMVKTKRYTHSRIRRIACSALVGLTAECQSFKPTAIRILGMNRAGKEILSSLRGNHKLPISPKFADLNRRCPGEFETEHIATDIALLSAPRLFQGGADFRENTIVIA